jgi:hypothetical protein
MVGCAVRTENKMQAIDAWCAWRTLQTPPYMNAVILRINQSFPRAEWWYEEAGGYFFATAVRCRSCRSKERERKRKARIQAGHEADA